MPAEPAYPLRRLPSLGGAAIGLVCGGLLATLDGERVAALVALAGLPMSPSAGSVAVAGGLFAAVVGWAVLYLIWGRGGWLDRPRTPRAPARRPLSFADLGPPPPREQPLPTDLDQPLSAFDPDAIDFYQRRGR